MEIEKYISTFPIEVQKRLQAIRKCIQAAAPGAKESIKWGMPAFSYKRILVTYAAFKSHIGLYPTPSAIEAFRAKLIKYKTAKGSIQFQNNEALPLPLITQIVKFRVKESIIQDAKWKL